MESKRGLKKKVIKKWFRKNLLKERKRKKD
jgi:hypothetical protein